MTVVFYRKKEIKMWCDAAGKPTYLEGVEWQDVGLRERDSIEIVHLRDEQYQPCRVCGANFGVWVENESSHATHNMRCDPMLV